MLDRLLDITFSTLDYGEYVSDRHVGEAAEINNRRWADFSEYAGAEARGSQP